jgi:glycosyltransferase involved in cell wall biosynthesis
MQAPVRRSASSRVLMMENDARAGLRVLQVNTNDGRGGAARVATSLHRAYRARGLESWLVVGHKLGDDEYTLPIRHDRASAWWQRPLWQAADSAARDRSRRARWLRNVFQAAAEPGRLADHWQGYEDFRYPGTAQLLDLPGEPVDILHLHNLHGRYFDLRQLPQLTANVPTVLSPHDAWLLSGHCAHSLGCERWRTGCGHCPDLRIQPAILRDATAENWLRKREIFARSRYHVAVPCRWLADRILASPLAAGAASTHIIPHGVDLSLFRPGDQIAARQALGLPGDRQIILMAGNDMTRNPWKGYATARAAFARLASERQTDPLLVLVLGDTAAEEHLPGVTIRFVPYVHETAVLTHYYQAADLFLSTAREELWGLAITEAMACGTPVVATAVGGTPEQITSWEGAAPEKANGILVQPDDADGVARALTRLLNDDAVRRELGRNAELRAHSEFDINNQVAQYLALYGEILDAWPG